MPVTITSPGVTETRAYDPQGRLTSLTLTDTTSHTAPCSTTGQTRTYSYSWDANGRLLSENGRLPANGTDDDLTSYTYDTSGNMLTATNPLGHVTTYAGQYANGRPASMTDPNGVVTTNAMGNVVTPANDFLRPGFPGQSQVLAGLYYNRARDYDPVLGRYIQADPIGLAAKMNPYLYTNTDPVNGIDPEGLFVKELGGPLLLGGGNLVYQLYQNGGRIDCVDWSEVGGWALEGTGLGHISINGIPKRCEF